jgi:hypothetical protein
VARVGAMDEKARRRAVTAMLDKLRADMLAAINKMPDDWETEEIGWYLVRSAKLMAGAPYVDRRRRIAYERAIRSRGL